MIGGVFIKMLEDPLTWKKWSSRDTGESRRLGTRACAAANHRGRADFGAKPAIWRYTFTEAGSRLGRPGFDDSEWKQGPAASAPRERPARSIGTTWNTPDIWLRREITLPAGIDPVTTSSSASTTMRMLRLRRRRARGRADGYVTAYELVEITPEAQVAAEAGAKVGPRRPLPSNRRRAGGRRRAGRRR